MKYREDSWGWPVAAYLFLGGLGGGMVIVSTGAELFFRMGHLFVSGNFLAAFFIAIGSGLLIFELGRPFQFWRVFSTQKAVMTVGAWLLGILIITSLIYGSFWLASLPWIGFITLRTALAWLNLLLGIGVVSYTGILLGSMRPRVFWNSPALTILFFVSGLSTGVAAQSLIAGRWPLAENRTGLLAAENFLHALDIGLLSFEIMVLAVFLGMMRTTSGEAAARAADRMLTGSFAVPFWLGLVTLGLVLPILFYSIGGSFPILAAIFVLLGGITLRFLIVYSADRNYLPGEYEYLSKLPGGDEAFLHAWKK